jgi:hypothetical protein
MPLIYIKVTSTSYVSVNLYAVFLDLYQLCLSKKSNWRKVTTVDNNDIYIKLNQRVERLSFSILEISVRSICLLFNH